MVAPSLASTSRRRGGSRVDTTMGLSGNTNRNAMTSWIRSRSVTGWGAAIPSTADTILGTETATTHLQYR